MRTYDVTMADLAEQETAVVRGRVPHDGIGPFVGTALDEVMEAIGSAGVRPAGPPFARYLLEEDGTFDIEVGCPVAGMASGSGRVELSRLPGGKAAKVLHRGAYAELAGAYQAAERWIQENAMRQDGAAWEVYLDEPSVPEPRTEVFVPCTDAHR